MNEPLPGICGKRFLTTYLTITGFGAHGGSGDESSKEVTIQYYAAIQCYANQLKSEDEKIVSITEVAYTIGKSLCVRIWVAVCLSRDSMK